MSLTLLTMLLIHEVNNFNNLLIILTFWCFYWVAVGSQRGVLWVSRMVHRCQQIGRMLDHISLIWPLEEKGIEQIEKTTRANMEV